MPRFSSFRYISVGKPTAYVLKFLSALFYEVQPQNVNSLLLLFINQSLVVNSDTVQLLADYLTICSFPVLIPSGTHQRAENSYEDNSTTTSCPRSAILRWLFKSSMETNEDWILGNESLLATILCSLFVKQSYTLAQCEQLRSNKSLKRTLGTKLNVDFEEMLLRFCFIKPSEDTLSKATETYVKLNANVVWRQNHVPFSVMNVVAERLIRYLKDLNNVPAVACCANISKLQARVSLLMNILNMFNKYKLGDVHLMFKTEIEKMTENFILRFGKMFVDYLAHVKANDRSPLEVWELLKKFKSLFSIENFNEETKAWYSQRFPLHVLDGLKKIFRSSLKKYLLDRESKSKILF